LKLKEGLGLVGLVGLELEEGFGLEKTFGLVGVELEEGFGLELEMEEGFGLEKTFGLEDGIRRLKDLGGEARLKRKPPAAK